jgi:hypothetical protein
MREILFDPNRPQNRDPKLKTLLDHLVEKAKIVDEGDVLAKLLVFIGAAVSEQDVLTVTLQFSQYKLHMMSMSLVHASIDLCAYPAYIDQLHLEIAEKIPPSPMDWHVDAVGRLKKLDAFF